MSRMVGSAAAADPTLAEELGLRPKNDLTTMCRDFWNWQTKNTGGYGKD